MFKYRIVLALVLAGLSGCMVVFPKSAALENVHLAYRQEFAKSTLGVPKSSLCKSDPQPDQFPVTRAEIDAFRSKYGTDGPEAAHLTVLEGMIYLQMTQFGLAKVVQDDVSAAGAKLGSGTGEKVRDALFSENYRDLVAGWEATCKGSEKNDGLVRYNAAARLDQAAGGIETALNSYSKDGKLPSVEVDQGALYLMATAVLFRQSEVNFLKRACITRGVPADCRQKATEAENQLVAAVCQMKPMLTAAEQNGEATKELETASLQGRLRYAETYRNAFEKAGSPTCAPAS